MSKKLFSLLILVTLIAGLLPAAALAAPPMQEGGTTYTVQKDDWLSKLAEKEYGDLLAFPAIVYYNNLKAAEDDSFAVIENADLIEVGWTIYIPSPEEAAAYLTGAVAPEAAEEQPSFEGQKVVVVTQTGRSIGGPIEDFAPEWEALTGGEVELQQFAFGELFEKMITSFETGAVDYDMLVFPADWAGDFMAPGYLEPVPPDILAGIDPTDIIPLYGARITAWGDTVYALPYDGDAHMLYYRKDLVAPDSPYAAEFEAQYGYPLDEPATWSQYYDIAEFFNGREVETAGEIAPIYGVAEAQRRNAQSYWVFLSHAAGYGKVPGNPCFFFSCDDMTPQVNNPGWVQALEDYIKSRDLGPPEQLQWDVADTRVQFPAGVSVLNIDWGDVGPISYNPDASVIIGDTGFAPLPAGDRYWNYETGEWVEEANPAPFIAFGGWIIGVAADSDVKEAALDFASFMAQPEMVQLLAVTPDTGINPSRYSQFENLDLWVNAGFDPEGAEDYLDAVLNTIAHPNAVLDLRIRGSAEYLNVLDVEVSRALADEITAQEALDNVAAGWDEITDRLGRESQLQQYRSAVGYTGS
jgi:multiple sugar transport system substrate-binding protein